MPWAADFACAAASALAFITSKWSSLQIVPLDKKKYSTPILFEISLEIASWIQIIHGETFRFNRLCCRVAASAALYIGEGSSLRTGTSSGHFKGKLSEQSLLETACNNETAWTFYENKQKQLQIVGFSIPW